MIIFTIKIYKVRKINTDMAFCVKCGARKDEVDNYCVVCGSKHLIETEQNHKIKLDERLQNDLRYNFFNSNIFDTSKSNVAEFLKIFVITIVITIGLIFLFVIWLVDSLG